MKGLGRVKNNNPQTPNLEILKEAYLLKFIVRNIPYPNKQ